MVYYGVANGRSKGVFKSWESCKPQVSGFSGSDYRKFDTKAEARAYSHNSSAPSSSTSSHSTHTSTVSLAAPSSKHASNSGSASLGKNVTKVYIDGASRGSGLPGVAKSGYGVYFGENDSRNKAVPLSKVENAKHHNPTGQRAELHAAADALDTIRREVKANPKSSGRYEILTDSTYTKQSLTDRQNSKTSGDNKDLIDHARSTLDDINSTLASRGQNEVTFTHVSGHQGVHGNEQADRLANQGADQYDSYSH